MGPDTGAHIQHSEQMWGSAIQKKKTKIITGNIILNHIYANLCADTLEKVKIHLAKVLLTIK